MSAMCGAVEGSCDVGPIPVFFICLQASWLDLRHSGRGVCVALECILFYGRSLAEIVVSLSSYTAGFFRYDFFGGL